MRSIRRTHLLELVCLSLILVAVLSYVIAVRPRREHPAPDNAVYIWQRAWNDALRESLHRFSDNDYTLMVFAGEFRKDDASIQYVPVGIDWKCLASSNKKVSLVFRIFTSAAGEYRLSDREDLAGRVAEAVESSTSAAKRSGINVSGAQIDFDCPSSKLDFYSSFLLDLKKKLGDINLSITALPTYLKYPSFRRVLSNVDYYVLQVHGIEKPRNINDPIYLWHPENVEDWVSSAERIGVPFYVALPTYGYEVVFDENGAYSGLRAEEENRVWPAEYSRKIVMAQPEDVVEVIHRIRRKNPRWLIGMAWFRMPVEGDELNWPFKTFETVVSGRIPEWKFSTEIRHPEKDLWEVWVKNEGEIHGPRELLFTVKWSEADVEAYDILGGFHIERGEIAANELRLVGKAPPLDAPVLAAWFRTASSSNDGNAKIEVSEVELQ